MSVSGPHDVFDQLRYELKMVADVQMLFEIRNWVRLHPSGFQEAYPSRRVNNVYFDTFGHDALLDHINGVSSRRKLRFRWYGRSFENIIGHLEVKQKTNRLGNKLNSPVEKEISLLPNNWESIQGILIESSSGLIKEMLNVSRPVFFNFYERDYFVSGDRTTRLTIDYFHKVYDQRLSSVPNVHFQQPILDKVVIEVKTDVENSENLAQILSFFPLRITRNSKFLDSMESILG